MINHLPRSAERHLANNKTSTHTRTKKFARVHGARRHRTRTREAAWSGRSINFRVERNKWPPLDEHNSPGIVEFESLTEVRQPISPFSPLNTTHVENRLKVDENEE
jgi:hypothetical protein